MKTTLYFTAGNSDKIYSAWLEEANGGDFNVLFEYGRRGSKLVQGSKTPIPVSRKLADDILARLLAEKRGKGYSDDAAGRPYDGDASRIAEVLPHPAKVLASAEELQSLIDGGAGIAQRKYDGCLARLDIGGGTVLLGERMAARSGAFLTAVDRADLARFGGTFFAAFTVESWQGQPVLNLAESERMAMLNGLTLPAGVILAESVGNVAAVMASGAEGVVFRNGTSGWSSMAAHKAEGIWLCKVTRIDGTLSVGIVDAETGEARGNVTLHSGVDQVRLGSIIRVAGMNLTKDGKIRQPTKCRDFLVSY